MVVLAYALDRALFGGQTENHGPYRGTEEM